MLKQQKMSNGVKEKLGVPKFNNAAEERRFWSRLKLNKYFEPSDFESASLPNLKPTSRPISIRIPASLLFRIKERANEFGIPYQSLIKQYLAEVTRK